MAAFTSVFGYIVFGEPDMDQATTCADCGFDAVAIFPLTSLTSEGVGPFGTYATCLRCLSEQGSDDE